MKVVILLILFTQIGCSSIGGLAANTLAGALGNMLDRRVDSNDNEKLENRIEELELELIEELEQRLNDKEKLDDCKNCEVDKWGRVVW
tara:strand:+ start:87 stop:350 length:264 start_codon:yes stop_codon:yes gene_type:complete